MPGISIRKPQARQTLKPVALRYKGPFKKSTKIARHYGFHLVEPINRKRELERTAKELQGKRKREKAGEPYLHLGDKFAEIHHYINQLQDWPQPAMICHTQWPRRKVGKVRLTAFGSTKSIAEALVLGAALAILNENGHDNLCIDINSLGDSSSRATFRERFVAHVKKHLENIHPAHQTTFKKDALHFSTIDNETCVEVRNCGPASIDFLSREQRMHLKEVLEYVESMGTLYRINNDLVGSDHHESQVLFQIKKLERDEDGAIVKEEILARGERHESLPGELGYQRSIPSVSISIDVPGGRRESYKQKKANRSQSPQVYYIHLGIEAKQRSISVLETLRKENINVTQMLCADRIRGQIQDAKECQARWAVIMGIKEAQEDSVIVRRMSTRSQETIPLRHLPGYLKQRVK